MLRNCRRAVFFFLEATKKTRAATAAAAARRRRDDAHPQVPRRRRRLPPSPHRPPLLLPDRAPPRPRGRLPQGYRRPPLLSAARPPAVVLQPTAVARHLRCAAAGAAPPASPSASRGAPSNAMVPPVRSQVVLHRVRRVRRPCPAARGLVQHRARPVDGPPTPAASAPPARGSPSPRASPRACGSRSRARADRLRCRRDAHGAPPAGTISDESRRLWWWAAAATAPVCSTTMARPRAGTLRDTTAAVGRGRAAGARAPRSASAQLEALGQSAGAGAARVLESQRRRRPPRAGQRLRSAPSLRWPRPPDCLPVGAREPRPRAARPGGRHRRAARRRGGRPRARRRHPRPSAPAAAPRARAPEMRTGGRAASRARRRARGEPPVRARAKRLTRAAARHHSKTPALPEAPLRGSRHGPRGLPVLAAVGVERRRAVFRVRGSAHVTLAVRVEVARGELLYPGRRAHRDARHRRRAAPEPLPDALQPPDSSALC